MSEKQWFAGLAAATLLAAAGIWYFFFRSPAAVDVPPTVPAAVSTPAATEPQYPLPATEADAAAPPLPSLAESDGPFIEALRGLFGAAGIDGLMVREQLIRRIVITVDNLPRERVGLREWPVKRSPGSLAVQDGGGRFTLLPENAARYDLPMALIAAADPAALAALYIRYYPLFNAAYREIGYPDGHFNDRLVQVIDHLLATPEVSEPVLLVRPKVVYEFADPVLEALSFGQKLLIRFGAAHRATVKAKLVALRSQVVTLPPGG